MLRLRWSSPRRTGRSRRVAAGAGVAMLLLVALRSPSAADATSGGALVNAATSSVTGTLSLSGTATGAPMVGARGRVRTSSDAGALVVATIVDAAGRSATSAPLHLSSQWQTFGVTLAHPALGGLTVTLAPPSSSVAWPAGAELQVAGVSLGDTGRSTLTRVAGTNYFDLTPYGGTAAPFAVHGFDYGPSPIGAEIGTPWEDPTTCQTDAQTLGGAGVTMVASGIYSAFSDDVLEDPANLVKCADAFWARGIGFGWLYAIQSISGDGAGFVQDFETRFQAAIALLGDHPATYTWLVGNEMNLNGRDGSCFFDRTVPGQPACADPTGGHYLAQLVDYLHTNDAGHPVTTKLSGDGGGGCGTGGVLAAADVPALDYWGVDAYPATTFGTLFSCMQTEEPTRPVLMTEFAHVSLNGTTVNYLCPPGSHEDDRDASFANTSLWKDILGAVASPSNASGEMMGGTEFMYSDLWWFSWGFPFFGGEALSPNDHDTIAVQGGNWYPSGWWSPEWAGVAQAQSAAQAELGQPRVTTPEVAAIAQLWGASMPTVSNVVVTPTGTTTTACLINVTWTSATPATSVVSWGQVNYIMPQAFQPIHDIEADDTNYTSQLTDNTLTTTHSVTLPGRPIFAQGAILPGATYRIAAGGFDANHGSDMSAGINVTVPALSCT
jgi:hypothetical protein